MGLGYNDPWVELHIYFQVFADMGSNIILKLLQKYVIVKVGETRGSGTELFIKQFAPLKKQWSTLRVPVVCIR